MCERGGITAFRHFRHIPDSLWAPIIHKLHVGVKIFANAYLPPPLRGPEIKFHKSLFEVALGPYAVRQVIAHVFVSCLGVFETFYTTNVAILLPADNPLCHLCYVDEENEIDCFFCALSIKSTCQIPKKAFINYRKMYMDFFFVSGDNE